MYETTEPSHARFDRVASPLATTAWGGDPPPAWYERAILVRPQRVRENLARVCTTYELPQPTPWQLSLGVLRLWHRLAFRTDTVGTSSTAPIRNTRRARLLAWRVFRLPALLRERAVVPLDHSGLGSSPERLIRHLLGAHHDANQFIYDLEILGGYGKLADLHREVTAVIARDDARSRWLRDLAVFDGYHEALLVACEHAMAHGPAMTDAEARDPDISLRAYLAWCAQQPMTPRATLDAWRAGTFRFDSPLEEREPTVLTPRRARELSARELANAFAAGRPVELDEVAGWIYRGTSLGLPRWIEKLSWIKFAKAFHRDGDIVRGWNLRIEQDALDRPWRPQLRRGRAVTFGPFVAVRDERGTVLDYGLGGGGLRVLRDPLVALDDRGDVLLGRSLLQLGVTVPTPSYFLLERDTRVVDVRA